LAMTGEITLRGRILPIGGLKEKLLAALRGGIKKVLIPEENAKDLAEIPDNVKSRLDIVPVSRMDEVLTHALTRKPETIIWDGEKEAAEAAKAPPAAESPIEEEPPGLTAHCSGRSAISPQRRRLAPPLLLSTERPNRLRSSSSPATGLRT